MQSFTATANVTQQPELRYTPNHMAVLDLNCVVNERKKVGEEWVDDPVYFEATFWGKSAEYLSENAKPGDTVEIKGRLKLETWETEDGKRSKHKIATDPTNWPVLYRRKPKED